MFVRVRVLMMILAAMSLAGVVAACSKEEQPAGKWGYINPRGDFVIPPRFDQASSFMIWGTAIVREGKKLRQIDRSTNDFLDLPPSANATASLEPLPALVATKLGEQFGLKDSKGELIYNPKTRERTVKYEFFHSGLACARFGKSFGFVSPEGKIVIEPQFQAARDFTNAVDPDVDAEQAASDALAAVKVGGKWGYINTRGDYVIKPKFAEAGRFVTGLAPVKVANQN